MIHADFVKYIQHDTGHQIYTCSKRQTWFSPSHLPQMVTGVPGAGLPRSERSTLRLESWTKMLYNVIH